MNTLLQDIKYGVRMLLKSPGLTAAAVVALALGIGANTAIFSVVNSVLLRGLPYHDAGRLVVIWETNPSLGGGLADRNEASPANFLDWKAAQTSFEEMGAYNWNTYNLSEGDTPERIIGNPVTAGLFPVLGVRPALGRFIQAGDDQESSPRVVLLSHNLWRRRFGSDPSIVGRELVLNNLPHTVVGVMPEGFEFPNRGPELWTAIRFSPQQAQSRGAHYLYTRARLREGVSLEQAQAELRTVAARLEQQYPDTNTQRSVRLVPLHEETVRNFKPALLVMFATVGLVLLIACANVANLMLARAASRQKEIAIRTALGAGRWRIVRQLLTESVMLALAGGLGGALLALWGIDLLKAGVPEQMGSSIYGWDRVGVDARVLSFTLGVSLLTGIVFGLAPALSAARGDVGESLKDGERGSTGGRRRLRGALVVAEVALSLVLLVGAGLMIKSFLRLVEVEPGFDPRNVLTASLSVPRARYPDNNQVAGFYAQLVERLRVQPGVESAAAVNLLPMAGSGATTLFTVEGAEAPPRGQEPEANYRTVTPGYFETMRIPVLRGRAIDERDKAEATRIVLVNETLARLHFAGADPIGRRLLDPSGQNPPVEIVGVVGDIKHWGLDDKPEAYIYLSHAQTGGNFMTVVARTSGEPGALVGALRREVQAIDRDQPVFDFKTMEERISEQSALKRLLTWLLGVMAAVALVLASIGIYGVIAYTVAQRTHEIGIRMALGARRGDIMRLVLRHGMGMAVAGILLGLAATAGLMLLLSKALEKMLFAVGGLDPTTYAGVALLLAAVALLACVIPARRATKVDPMEALRYE